MIPKREIAVCAQVKGGAVMSGSHQLGAKRGASGGRQALGSRAAGGMGGRTQAGWERSKTGGEHE